MLMMLSSISVLKDNVLMMLSSISVLKAQLLAPPLPTLTYVCLLCFNGLSLNPDNSEAILYNLWYTSKTLYFPCHIHISDTNVELFDQTLVLVLSRIQISGSNAHIIVLCKACHFHLRSLPLIRCSHTDDMAIQIAVVLV